MAVEDEQLQTNFHDAAGMGDTERVRELLEDGADVNEQNDDGQSPLHTAVYYQPRTYVCLPDILVCQTLINNGADVNQQDKRGNTPLHLLSRVHSDTLINNDMAIQQALFYEDVYSTLVTLLIANGADVNIRNGSGRTALSGWMLNLEGNVRIVENGARPGYCFKYLALLLVIALMVCPVLLRTLFPPERLRLI